MPEPLPKIPEDPTLRLALAIEFLAAFETAKTDDDVNDWLKANTPRLVDAVAIAELALAQCTPGSQWEPLRERMANVVTHLQGQIIRYDEHMETLGKQDMFGAIRRVIYDMATSGDMPVDWQTREGCKFSLCRWIAEFFDAVGDKILYKRDGDNANARLAMLDTYAALETAMDRVLTLPAEDRARFLPLIEPLYSGYMANREKNLKQ